MFVTRIIDGQLKIRDFRFKNEACAVSYYDETDVDDNTRSISVLEEENNTVICIKIFKNKTIYKLKNGDIVKLRPEYRTADEAKYVFSVSDINESTERCSITCVNGKMSIPSKETVSIDMIKPI